MHSFAAMKYVAPWRSGAPSGSPYTRACGQLLRLDGCVARPSRSRNVTGSWMAGARIAALVICAALAALPALTMPLSGRGTDGAAALAVTGPPLSCWTQPCACRVALYWLRAATRARPAASTTSVDDARTATLRPGSSTSSSTSPTASLPGPTE